MKYTKHRLNDSTAHAIKVEIGSDDQTTDSCEGAAPMC
jgi:hypothetical protein